MIERVADPSSRVFILGVEKVDPRESPVIYWSSRRDDQ